ncbi:hypothetical protein J6352_15950 [Burkholderia pseudomallei]|uniref:hypothetical protein n=1 Tax=Burkholderia pseudomallei TaxID=28450 RepID=UPI001AD68488|nr:hypothetical protein [Burkholderia pseudomallei]MBO7772916.1 hypothetical protein [Burkholderia pseudomallei]MBO7906874.1 hypothetical protein [Burkholderia pseudomallei]
MFPDSPGRAARIPILRSDPAKFDTRRLHRGIVADNFRQTRLRFPSNGWFGKPRNSLAEPRDGLQRLDSFRHETKRRSALDIEPAVRLRATRPGNDIPLPPRIGIRSPATAPGE